MALIECKECQSQISDKAESCPQCGCPLKKQKVIVENKITGGGDIIHKIAVWGVIILVLFFIGYCAKKGAQG